MFGTALGYIETPKFLYINHLGNIIDSSVLKDYDPWGLGAMDINASFQRIKTAFFKEGSLRR